MSSKLKIETKDSKPEQTGAGTKLFVEALKMLKNLMIFGYIDSGHCWLESKINKEGLAGGYLIKPNSAEPKLHTVQRNIRFSFLVKKLLY